MSQPPRRGAVVTEMNGPKVEDAALVKPGYMLETPSIRRYSPRASDNASGADNQQGSRPIGLTPQRLYAGLRNPPEKR